MVKACFLLCLQDADKLFLLHKQRYIAYPAVRLSEEATLHYNLTFTLLLLDMEINIPRFVLIKISTCLLVFSLFVQYNYAQDYKEIPLYTGKPPYTKSVSVGEEKGYDLQVDSLVSKVSVPTLSVFIPATIKPNATSVIICPGGGYHTELIEREGRRVARAFNTQGIVAFVLKYRLPDEQYFTNAFMVPLTDVQRAIQLVREKATEWNINPSAVGIMGFSAGGHLAATAGTHFDSSFLPGTNNGNLRPDFMILINPVMSFSDKTGHAGSRINLVGNNPSKKRIDFFSAEKNVTETTPPAFLAHTADDRVVPLANSLDFFYEMKKKKIACEIHVYAAGDHGFLKDTPPFSQWFNNCIYWMQSTGWLK
jgi:acetyl esterase/lipase